MELVIKPSATRAHKAHITSHTTHTRREGRQRGREGGREGGQLESKRDKEKKGCQFDIILRFLGKVLQ